MRRGSQLLYGWLRTGRSLRISRSIDRRDGADRWSQHTGCVYTHCRSEFRGRLLFCFFSTFIFLIGARYLLRVQTLHLSLHLFVQLYLHDILWVYKLYRYCTIVPFPEGKLRNWRKNSTFWKMCFFFLLLFFSCLRDGGEDYCHFREWNTLFPSNSWQKPLMSIFLKMSKPLL